MKPLQTT